MRHRTIRRLAAILVVLSLALNVTSAFAGDPTSAIIADIAKDGKIDGHYTKAQLQAAAKSPLLAQYGGTGGVAGVQGSPGTKGGGNNGSSSGGGTAPATSAPAATSSGTLPFTGADIALFVVVGGALVVAGFGLRRLGRSGETPTA